MNAPSADAERLFPLLDFEKAFHAGDGVPLMSPEDQVHEIWGDMNTTLIGVARKIHESGGVYDPVESGDVVLPGIEGGGELPADVQQGYQEILAEIAEYKQNPTISPYKTKLARRALAYFLNPSLTPSGEFVYSALAPDGTKQARNDTATELDKDPGNYTWEAWFKDCASANPDTAGGIVLLERLADFTDWYQGNIKQLYSLESRQAVVQGIKDRFKERVQLAMNCGEYTWMDEATLQGRLQKIGSAVIHFASINGNEPEGAIGFTKNASDPSKLSEAVVSTLVFLEPWTHEPGHILVELGFKDIHDHIWESLWKRVVQKDPKNPPKVADFTATFQTYLPAMNVFHFLVDEGRNNLNTLTHLQGPGGEKYAVLFDPEQRKREHINDGPGQSKTYAQFQRAEGPLLQGDPHAFEKPFSHADMKQYITSITNGGAVAYLLERWPRQDIVLECIEIIKTYLEAQPNQDANGSVYDPAEIAQRLIEHFQSGNIRHEPLAGMEEVVVPDAPAHRHPTHLHHRRSIRKQDLAIAA